MRTPEKYRDLCPSPAEIKMVQQYAGASAVTVSEWLYITPRTYRKYKCGQLPMPPALWELLNLKANQAANRRRFRSDDLERDTIRAIDKAQRTGLTDTRQSV